MPGGEASWGSDYGTVIQVMLTLLSSHTVLITQYSLTESVSHWLTLYHSFSSLTVAVWWKRLGRQYVTRSDGSSCRAVGAQKVPYCVSLNASRSVCCLLDLRAPAPVPVLVLVTALVLMSYESGNYYWLTIDLVPVYGSVPDLLLVRCALTLH